MTATIISLAEYRRRRAINPLVAMHRANVAWIRAWFCWWEEIAR